MVICKNGVLSLGFDHATSLSLVCPFGIINSIIMESMAQCEIYISCGSILKIGVKTYVENARAKKSRINYIILWPMSSGK